MSTGLKRAAIALVGLAIAAFAAFVTRDRWKPLLNPEAVQTQAEGGPDEHGHNHDHAKESADKLNLSDQARENLGLQFGKVTLKDDVRTIQVPGVVVEEPGHSERRIPAAMDGIVTKVHVFPGQSVRPGDPLLDLQPTGEQLSNDQSALLRTLQDIELIDLELKRITPLVDAGSLPAKNKIEKDYERKRLESQRLVQTQELLVRGLTPSQVDEIVKTRFLIRQFTIHVPEIDRVKVEAISPSGQFVTKTVELNGEITSAGNGPETNSATDRNYTVERINVFPGKLVGQGDELMDLAFHQILNVEGLAFEREAPLVRTAVQNRWNVTAEFETTQSRPLKLTDLKIRYLDNMVDPVTRIQKFYVRLVNTELKESTSEDGVTFRLWTFKPGQFVRLYVPFELKQNQIVLPAEAVIRDGADAYVFKANGRLLQRTAVAVEHMDSREAVIKNDGTLLPGFDVVALNQAYQLNLALKKLAGEGGGGGHSHHGHEH